MRLSPWTIARSPLEIRELFFRQSRGGVDRIGVNVHLALACAAALCAGMPTTVLEWAGLPVLLATLVRMTEHHRMLRPLWLDGVMLLIGAWAALLAASILWTAGDARAWLGDVAPLRFVAFLLIFWAVLEHRRAIIICLMLGLLVGQAVQLAHALGLTSIQRAPGRVSGWWDPVVAGSLLCAGLGMHLALALLGQGARLRLLGALGVIATLAGIIATGTRGAWSGAAGVVAFALGLSIARLGPRAMIPAAGVGLAGVLVIGTVLAIPGSPARQRLDAGFSEARAALAEDRFNTDTGLRVAMWRWAGAAFVQHPLLGVGAGGYRAWATAQSPERARELGAPPRAARRVHAHAHSLYFHALATTGVLGTSLLLGGLALAVLSGLRGPRDGAMARGLDAAPALGIVGLLAAGVFDSVQVNQQTAFVLWILVALCMPMRPRAIGEPRTASDTGGGA
jgi:O-antigen ligase